MTIGALAGQGDEKAALTGGTGIARDRRHAEGTGRARDDAPARCGQERREAELCAGRGDLLGCHHCVDPSDAAGSTWRRVTAAGSGFARPSVPAFSAILSGDPS